jgi:HK97 family phage major capsid protein
VGTAGGKFAGAGGETEYQNMTKKEARAALNAFIRRGEMPEERGTGNPESRALGIDSPTVTQTQSVAVQAAFLKQLMRAMLKYDSLFDPDVVTLVTSKNGSNQLVPTINDTANAATVVGEAVQDTEVDPTTGGVLVPTASTYRTGMVQVSRELLEDGEFDPADYLAKSFAIRLARAIGASIVATVLAGAQSGATGSSATTVTPNDVLALIESVDPAYLESPKAGLAMNFKTLLTIRGTQTTTGAYVLPPDCPEIFGLPVFICPSMPAIGASAIPVVCGDFGYLATRVVEGGQTLQRLEERYAEYGLIGFRGWLRASSALGVPAALKYLQQPS